ncbi:MAG: RNA polymerase sigma factor [Planctomycetota bacterium]|jgi:RNA polymerase sigma-70 factor (ECF subfamily)
MTDSILLDVATGQSGAVDRCIRTYSGPVWSLARRYSSTEQDAEDAVQEVFLDVWKSAQRFDQNVGSEMTFIMTIARRRLIDRARRKGRRPEIQSLPEAEVVAEGAARDQAELQDEVRLVRDAMEQLKPEQRDVLRLSLVQGHTHQQVAERTGLPLGTVKSHARRGLMRVRELLKSKTGAGQEDES